jgi:hypothetical protein
VIAGKPNPEVTVRYTSRHFSGISTGYCSTNDTDSGCTDVYPVSRMPFKKMRRKYICSQKLDVDYDDFIVSDTEEVRVISAQKKLANVGKTHSKHFVWMKNIIAQLMIFNLEISQILISLKIIMWKR